MVIGVLADVLEVVVLAAGPDALLGVGRPRVGARAPAQEDVLELVHPRVGEQQRRDRRAARPATTARTVWPRFDEEVDELLADLRGGSGHDFLTDRGRKGQCSRCSGVLRAAPGGNRLCGPTLLAAVRLR